MLKLTNTYFCFKFKKIMPNDKNSFKYISSDEETIVSKDRFSELVLKLEQVLDELKKEDEEEVLNLEVKKENSQNLIESKKEDERTDEESENEGSEKGFLDYHLNELKKLKEISSLKSLKITDINWFFDTALFNLMNELPEEFVIKPEEIYRSMLNRFEITSKEKFQEHLKVLLEQKTKEKEFLFVRFFPVLSAAKKRNSNVLDDSSSPETKRVKLPSPLSLENSSISFKSKV